MMVPWSGHLSWTKQVVLAFFFGTASLAAGCSGRGPVPKYPAGMAGREQRVRAALTTCGSCAKRSVLERRLERIHYNMAKERDDIASWRWFLAAHPKGLFAGEAERRLMELRFTKAKKRHDRWLWEWFLARYGDSPLAGEAEAALGALLAGDLARHPDAERIRAYLVRFPNDPHAKGLLALLEKMAFARLGPNAPEAALEAFLKEFSRSARADRVREWIAVRWRRRILRYGTPRDLAAYVRRFGSQSARDLERRLIERDAREAMADVDLERLALVSRSLSPAWRARISAFVRMAERDHGNLGELRELSLRARPFRPMASQRALLLATTSSDPLAAIAAVNALRFVRRVQAPRTLLLLAATASDPLAAAAWISLVRWVTDGAHPGAADLVDDLASDMASGAGTSLGRARAMALALSRPGHCEFGPSDRGTHLVVLGACLASGCCAGKENVQRLRRLVRKTRSWVLARAGSDRGRKPRDAAAAAVRLRVLEEFLTALSRSRKGPGQALLSGLRRELNASRRALELEVTGADKGYLLKLPFSVLRRASAHEGARAAAFGRICASRNSLDREVCRVLCEDERWRLDSVCPGPRPLRSPSSQGHSGLHGPGGSLRRRSPVSLTNGEGQGDLGDRRGVGLDPSLGGGNRVTVNQRSWYAGGLRGQGMDSTCRVNAPMGPSRGACTALVPIRAMNRSGCDFVAR